MVKTTVLTAEVLAELGIEERNAGGFAGEWVGSGKIQRVVSPVDGVPLADVVNVTKSEFDSILARTHAAWASWRTVPAPKRGEVVKALGDELHGRRHRRNPVEPIEDGENRKPINGEVAERQDQQREATQPVVPE